MVRNGRRPPLFALRPASRRPFRNRHFRLETLPLSDVAMDEDRLDRSAVFVGVRHDDCFADALATVPTPEPHLARPPSVLAHPLEHLLRQRGSLRGKMEDGRSLAEHGFLRVTEEPF